jgi:hypothetical protein
MSFPWTGFIPTAISEVRRSSWRNTSFRDAAPWFLLWQIVVVLGLFSLSQTKVWTYILPLFPALGLLIGRWLAGRPDDEPVPRGLQPIAWIFAALALVLAVAATVWPWDRLPLELQSVSVLGGIRACLWLLFALGAVFVGVFYRGTLQQACIALASGSCLWYLAVCLGFLPDYDRHWKQPVREVSACMRAYAHSKAVIYRMHELGLNFHSRSPIVRQWREDCPESLEDLLSSREPIFVLCPRKFLSDLDGLNFHIWGENPRFVWGANFQRGMSSPAAALESTASTTGQCNPGTNCMAGRSNPW